MASSIVADRRRDRDRRGQALVGSGTCFSAVRSEFKTAASRSVANASALIVVIVEILAPGKPASASSASIALAGAGLVENDQVADHSGLRGGFGGRLRLGFRWQGRMTADFFTSWHDGCSI